jgi:PEP-CTERM motif
MKRISRLAAGLAVAFATTVAGAQTVTLDFNDLPATATFFEGAGTSYMGFDFSSATGTPGSSWYWAPGDTRFVSGAGAANNNNITGYVDGAPTDQYDAFVISSATPFTFQSAFFSGGCDKGCATPLFLELLTTDGEVIRLGGFDDTLNPANATLNLPSSGGVTYTNSGYGNRQLAEIAVWAPSGQFSMDDVVLGQVAAVPEPSTYGLMAMGLAGVGFMVRRRKQAEAQV